MERIRDLLAYLYGESSARPVYDRLRKLVDRYAPRLPTSATSRRPWTERDVLLVTYGDQVRATGEPPLRTLADFLNAHASGLLGGVHILPFFPSSSDDGFSVIDYQSVDPALGAWHDISRLGQHFDLMFDLVLNHVSAESEWFRRFLQDDPAYRDFFITVDDDPDLSQVVRPRALPLLTKFRTPSGEKQVWTTFSADQIDLNYHNPEVLLRILETMLFYAEHGARFIRLDAIAYLWKEIGTSCIHLPQTHAVVRLMRAVLDQIAPGVLLITETNVPHADNLSYFGDGSDEAQMVYNFALPPLVLHALQTGSAAKLSTWAQRLSLPGDQVTLFNFLASHDGIGLNPARGILTDTEIEALVTRTVERGGLVSYKRNPDGSQSPYELNINYLDAISERDESGKLTASAADRFMTAEAIMLSLAGIPGVYFHSLFGSRGDRAAAEAPGIPRRINRGKPTREELERDLADSASLRSRILDRHTRLLRVRRVRSAFHPASRQRILGDDDRVFALLRGELDQDASVLCLFNVTRAPVPYQVSGLEPGRWQDLIGGGYCDVSDSGAATFNLVPFQTMWATRSLVR